MITGTGSIAKTGAGVLTLSGVNTYAGGTTISAGAIAVTDDSNLGNVAGGLTFNGGTLRVSTAAARLLRLRAASPCRPAAAPLRRPSRPS